VSGARYKRETRHGQPSGAVPRKGAPAHYIALNQMVWSSQTVTMKGRRLILHQHDVQPARPVRAEFQRLLDVRRP
jgi:hypothetical protein